MVSITASVMRRPVSDSVVSSPSSPSPRSMRRRMSRRSAEIWTTLSITSSPEAMSRSTLVGGAAGITPPGGRVSASVEPVVISTYLSPRSPRVLIRARESSRIRSA